jgi:hypothetical protein
MSYQTHLNPTHPYLVQSGPNLWTLAADKTVANDGNEQLVPFNTPSPGGITNSLDMAISNLGVLTFLTAGTYSINVIIKAQSPTPATIDVDCSIDILGVLDGSDNMLASFIQRLPARGVNPGSEERYISLCYVGYFNVADAFRVRARNYAAGGDLTLLSSDCKLYVYRIA